MTKTRMDRGTRIGSAVASVAWVALACACGSAKSPGRGTLEKLCAEASDRYARCARSDVDRATMTRACVESIPCVQRVVRDDVVLPYSECEARGPCEASCLEDTAARFAPPPQLVAFRARCAGLRTCSDRGDVCVPYQGVSFNALNGNVWAGMDGCLGMAPCAAVEQCLRHRATEIQTSMLSCSPTARGVLRR